MGVIIGGRRSMSVVQEALQFRIRTMKYGASLPEISELLHSRFFVVNKHGFLLYRIIRRSCFCFFRISLLCPSRSTISVSCSYHAGFYELASQVKQQWYRSWSS